MTIEKRPNATADKNAPTQAPTRAPIVAPGTGPGWGVRVNSNAGASAICRRPCLCKKAAKFQYYKFARKIVTFGKS